MVKLVALYKKPTDVEAFQKHYDEVHTPLAKKIPGLKKLEVARITGAPAGEAKFYMIADMYFQDQQAMTAGLNSPEGKAAAKDIMSIAGDIVHMMFATVDE